jgi:dihydroorotate dehydrogenase
LWKIALGGSIGFVALNVYKGNDRFYENVYGIGMPAIHRLVDPETAHRWAIKAAKHRIGTRLAGSDVHYDNLNTSVWNLVFDSPIGMAAGFDKNGEAVVGLADIGFSFVEVGSITPQAQAGNDRPRVFRLTDDKSIINRFRTVKRVVLPRA